MLILASVLVPSADIGQVCHMSRRFILLDKFVVGGFITLCDVTAICTGVLINPQPDQEGKMLQRQMILSFIIIIISVMGWGHLLTRSGLTYPEVSSKVCHVSFCQLDNSVSLPWVIYYEAFYLHLSFIYILFIIIIGGILVLCIYIYNKTSIKRNILTIKQNTSGSRSG